MQVFCAVSAVRIGCLPELSAVLGGVLLTPVFFLAGMHGLNASAILERALRCSSPSVSFGYRAELSRMAIISLVGFTAIFCFY